MDKVLILFSAFDGQTAQIAERVGAHLTRSGHVLSVVPLGDHDMAALVARHDAVVLAFVERTGWQPRATATFAGALRYSRCNLFVRFMVRLISGTAGGDTGTSRDREYTDWAAVERFGREFVRPLEPAAVPA